MSQRRLATGVGFVLAGVAFLLDALAVIDLWATAGGWWPVLLVVAGVVLLLRRGERPDPDRTSSVIAVLRPRAAEVPDRPFREGRVIAVLGHADFDLRRTALPSEGAELTVTAVLGDVAVTVPPGWRVRARPRLLVAEVDHEVLPAPDDAPVLTVRGLALLADLHLRTGSVVE